MNASETAVARVIDAHTPTGSQGNITCWCDQRFESWAEHATHVAAAVLAALSEQITTVAQLEALPGKSVVIDVKGDPWVKDPDDGSWFIWFYDFGDPASQVPLPARWVSSWTSGSGDA